MEHPFLVEEFTPERATQRAFTSANRFMTAEPQPSAALPPLPNLSASEALFLTPSDPLRQLLGFRQPSHPAQSGAPRGVQDRTRHRCHGRLGALQ